MPTTRGLMTSKGAAAAVAASVAKTREYFMMKVDLKESARRVMSE